MAIGAIAVPSFITNTEDDFTYIMDHSESVLAITSGGGVAQSVLNAAGAAGLKRVIVMEPEGLNPAAKTTMLNWQDELDKVETPPLLDDHLAKIAPQDTCCFIYTSGTGGRPKGVMLTHQSIQANINAAVELLAEGGVAEGQRFYRFCLCPFL